MAYNDDLIASTSVHYLLPIWRHLGIWPFFLFYMLEVISALFVYDYYVYSDVYFISTFVVAILQFVVCLSGVWSINIRCFLSCSKAQTSRTHRKGTVVKVIPTPNNGYAELVPVNFSPLENDDGSPLPHCCFFFQKTKYIWNSQSGYFESVRFPISNKFGQYLSWRGYQSDRDIVFAERRYSNNVMDMIVPEFWELFIERATAPFFVFQMLCVGLWCLDRYWYYSLFTLAMLVMFECMLVKQHMRSMSEIRSMGNKPYLILVYRGKKWLQISTELLIPGDLVSIGRSSNQSTIPCDMLLLRGSCIVDESMLTGETVPQMKEPIENFDAERNLDFEADSKLHVLFGGTRVVQHTPPAKNLSSIKVPDNGCMAYVLRTSFNTAQGKLLRTIMFGVKRITANNKETLAFILFLLIFALSASYYVWTKGVMDPKRNRYKLLLECVLIVTSVIPPELPVELSLAVNSSLVSLVKLHIFCTEPFRIPFAGKIQVCCFDKTGTLTSNDLVIEGVAGIKGKDSTIVPITDAPLSTIQVCASCHSLIHLEGNLVGDPMERATLKAVEWTLTKSDSVIPKKIKSSTLKIIHRFHFTSTLRRMSVLASYTKQGASDPCFIASVKGAPEVLKEMFVDIDESYDEIYMEMSRKGARVIALGIKELKGVHNRDLNNITRELLECDLKFAGFLIISCPLKADSKSVMKEILNSSHYAIMITGDNPLTACHVAKELLFTQKSGGTLILSKSEEEECEWEWRSIDQKLTFPFEKFFKKSFFCRVHDFCITGEGLSYVLELNENMKKKLFQHVSVFARVSPKQKEWIINTLKAIGYHTLMCGDGTNDVGALKHADVGVAILSNAPLKPIERPKRAARSIGISNGRTQPKNRNERQPNHSQRNERQDTVTNQLNKMMKDMENEDNAKIVKLGDASIAAPFTSKLSSIQCVCHIIKQGRCTLVTTLQMFKILALNALIMSYGQSVLYLDGVKFGDLQATIQGLLLAGCFLFISRSKPLKTLSRQRPLPNIFNMYTISTVMLQFAIHLSSLVYLVQLAKRYSDTDPTPSTTSGFEVSLNETTSILLDGDDEEIPFSPNVVNSTVYIVSSALQLITFAVNYRGYPFMESLTENRAFLYSLIISALVVIMLALGLSPSLAAALQVVDLAYEVRLSILGVMLVNLVLSFALDRLCRRLFGEGRITIEH